ncbi:hypothetical protein Dimus_030691 [Dionaea muscipula]
MEKPQDEKRLPMADGCPMEMIEEDGWPMEMNNEDGEAVVDGWPMEMNDEDGEAENGEASGIRMKKMSIVWTLGREMNR